ncbi:GcrA family cell cycle regulator [Bradyrhizobium sp. RT10b]|uniref:GcrA family cell cycle regulator n=1 Tax=Bradyrhizobium sp. RT10b TaxID=3156331 RepID=UPI00339B4CC0
MSSLGWTDDRIEMLKKLWTAGLSASQVATEIGGLTRNAVIGKVHRLGLEKRGKRHNPNVARPKRSSGVNAARLADARSEAVNGLPVAPQSRRSYFPPVVPANPHKAHQRAAVRMAGEPVPRMTPFLDRKEGECAFICTPAGAPVAVCGHTTLIIRGKRGPEKSSWCPFHYGFTHRMDSREEAA